jgi:hypothetical protein
MEQYIFFGDQDDTLFFLHTIYDYALFKDQRFGGISNQLYNCLIHDKFIISPNKNVIIYEINLNKKIINVISIQHEKGIFVEFDKENLENQLIRLVNLERNHEIYVVLFNYKIGGFQTYIITDLYLPSPNITNFNNNLTDIEYVITTKPFTV